MIGEWFSSILSYMTGEDLLPGETAGGIGAKDAAPESLPDPQLILPRPAADGPAEDDRQQQQQQQQLEQLATPAGLTARPAALEADRPEEGLIVVNVPVGVEAGKFLSVTLPFGQGVVLVQVSAPPPPPPPPPPFRSSIIIISSSIIIIIISSSSSIISTIPR